jgi:hypothetical protein
LTLFAAPRERTIPQNPSCRESGTYVKRALAIAGDVLSAVALTLMIPVALILLGLPLVLVVRLLIAAAGG